MQILCTVVSCEYKHYVQFSMRTATGQKEYEMPKGDNLQIIADIWPLSAHEAKCFDRLIATVKTKEGRLIKLISAPLDISGEYVLDSHDQVVPLGKK